MIIEDVAVSPCEMPLEDKDWKFALASVSSARGCVVAIRSDSGHTGYGYAPAIPHMGSTFEMLPIEIGRFKPILLRKDPFAIESLLREMDASMTGAYQAKGAIDCALHDLMARALGVPLYNLLGGKTRDKVPVLRILSLKTPAETAGIALKLFEQGYRYFKIKVHGEIDVDVGRVKAIRERLGRDAHLTIDANQSYSPKAAIEAIKRMAEYGLDLVEQPVPRNDLKGLELVTRSVPVVVEADEGANTVDDIMTLVSNRIVDAVSLKLPKLGGLRNALAAARICEAGNVRFRLGAHVGTRLLNAHAISLAAALPPIDYACEVGEFMRMYDDPFTGIEVVDGHIAIPDRVGCGVEPVNAAERKLAGAA